MPKLTSLKVKSLTKAGRHGDGGGLYLEVEPSGSKRWTLRIMAGGKRRDIGLGSANPNYGVPLAEAREKAAAVRKMIRDGLDPIAERRKARVAIPTFAEAASAFHAENLPSWRNDKHAAQWLATVERHVNPVIGSLKVNEIDGPTIRDLLLPIWLEIPETARRVRQRIGAVLDWAAAKGFRTGENPVRSVDKGLPRQPKARGHFKALEYRDVANFLKALRSEAPLSTARLAFEWLVLTASRTSETLGAQWSEIDPAAKTWTIPAVRMKGGRPHTIPLPARCLEILDQAKARKSGKGDYVFESRPGRPYSNMVFLKILDAMQMRDRATTHGFRSAFRDWAAETTSFPSDVIEMALAHAIRNKTEAAYRRGDLLEKRRELMAAWEHHCKGSAGNIVALPAKAIANRGSRKEIK